MLILYIRYLHSKVWGLLFNCYPGGWYRNSTGTTTLAYRIVINSTTVESALNWSQGFDFLNLFSLPFWLCLGTLVRWMTPRIMPVIYTMVIRVPMVTWNYKTIHSSSLLLRMQRQMELVQQLWLSRVKVGCFVWVSFSSKARFILPVIRI